MNLTTKEALNEILIILQNGEGAPFDYSRLDSIEYALGALFGFLCFYLAFQTFQSKIFR